MNAGIASAWLVALASCATAPASLPARPQARAVARQEPVPTKRVTLEELVHRCQPEMGLNVTFDERTAAALRARTLVWAGSERVETAEAARLFYAVLSAAGFECERVGPGDLGVIVIRAPR